jgi:hypothetical protein
MNASRAVPWLLSGLGHVATGFAMVIIGLGVHGRYRDQRPAAAQIALAAAMLAATGFLLTGISHVIGRQTLFLLSDANPKCRSAYIPPRLYGSGERPRPDRPGWFAAAVLLGGDWHAAPAFVLFGFLSGRRVADGRGRIPIYLFTVLWALWLAVALRLKAILRWTQLLRNFTGSLPVSGAPQARAHDDTVRVG